MTDKFEPMGGLRPALTRRGLLATAGGTAVGLGVGSDLLSRSAKNTGDRALLDARVPFYGQHQSGIATPTQNYLQFAAFDITSDSLSDVRQLLASWTRAAAVLTSGQSLSQYEDPNQAPVDPGEAIGLPPASLTITFGLGPAMFDENGHDRFGLRAQQPPELVSLPPFQGESLDPQRSGGDLCIQACAEDPQVAFHAIHALARIGNNAAVLRWLQAGFGRTSTTSRSQTTPRNLMGFKDGTNNIHAEDHAAMREFVWTARGDKPEWMQGGSYLVIRRIQILLDVWDTTSLGEQERTIGRYKLTGAPLGEKREDDPIDFAAESAGAPVIPSNAHIRLASPQFNSGERILRRGYSYSDGYDPITGQLDAGLFFIAYQRSPSRQFIPIQRRLSANDALNQHTIHTASAIFAVPPGTAVGGYIGDTLL